jgi:hypothetical protein
MLQLFSLRCFKLAPDPLPMPPTPTTKQPPWLGPGRVTADSVLVIHCLLWQIN